MIDATDFNNYITNDGAYPWGYASNQCMQFGDMQSHKVLQSSHATTIPSTASTVHNYYNAGIATYFLEGEAAAHTFTCSASTLAPSSTTPITLTLSSITGLPYQATANDGISKGNAGLTITLKDPGGTVRLTTVITTGSSGGASFSTPGYAAGAWVWSIIGTWDMQDNTGTSGLAHGIVYSGSFSSYY
jgi:hypothetical protein